MSASTAIPSPASEPGTWFGQPRGLTVLFLTNMWEQFSYFGMRALLVLYMTKELLLGQQASSVVYGVYTACAYFTPIVGGVVADRYLGKRRAVVIGASVMAVGHFMMAFEPLFYAALATIALGNGLFLPSLPSQINDLYRADDPRRAWAYNVYYVGINVGGLLAPLVCGTLGELYGWHYGFGAAGIGMVLGLGIYLWGGRYLPVDRGPGAATPTDDPQVASAMSLGRSTALLLVAVALSVTVFRGAYEQIGNTVALWIDTGVDRAIGGFTVPVTWFFALNPLLVMLMTPFLLRRWRRRAEAGSEWTAVRKMAAGALIVGAAFLLLAAAAAGVDGGARAGWPWLVAFFVLFTLGELYILPTGLGLFARVAPSGLGATTVAAWYLAIFSGSLAAGLVGTLWSSTSHPLYFAGLAALTGVAALMLRGLEPLERGLVADRDAAERF